MDPRSPTLSTALPGSDDTINVEDTVEADRSVTSGALVPVMCDAPIPLEQIHPDVSESSGEQSPLCRAATQRTIDSITFHVSDDMHQHRYALRSLIPLI